MARTRKVVISHSCGHTEQHQIAPALDRVVKAYGYLSKCSICVLEEDKRLRSQSQLRRKNERAKRKAAKRMGTISQRNVRALYQFVYGCPMPKGWRVQWAGFMRGAVGLCMWDEKKILLSYGDHIRKGANQPGSYYQVLGTLLHEFVHMRWPDLRHGDEFRRLESLAYRRLGVEKPMLKAGKLIDCIGEDK